MTNAEHRLELERDLWRARALERGMFAWLFAGFAILAAVVIALGRG